MVFNSDLEIGDIITNDQLVDIFKCGNMGGMRRSKTTNTLVIISDDTKGLYKDKWIGGMLHYTGMGKIGDQDLFYSQNKTLFKSNYNGVDVHLFEVFREREYTYMGQVYLAASPYQEKQTGEDGLLRKVWIFPVKVVDYNKNSNNIFIGEHSDKEPQISNDKEEEIHRVPGGAYFGSIVVAKDVENDDVFELPPIESNPKTKEGKEIKEAFLNKIKGATVVYKGYRYIVKEIR